MEKLRGSLKAGSMDALRDDAQEFSDAVDVQAIEMDALPLAKPLPLRFIEALGQPGSVHREEILRHPPLILGQFGWPVEPIVRALRLIDRDFGEPFESESEGFVAGLIRHETTHYW